MLHVENVTRDFEGLRAVDGASLTVPEGKIVGLIGPNGSGKSTLINVISGMMPPTSGKIQFDGHDITRLRPDQIFHLGLARGFQDAALFFQMTVLDNALLPVKRQAGERPWYAPWKRTWLREEREHGVQARGVLDRLDLRGQTRRRAVELSGGQMKLAELARSLMGAPKMLVLDEPTAGVTPPLARSIFEQIDALRRERGMTFLIVEHRLDILFAFVDTLYVMYLGKVIAQGTPGEIAENRDVREVYLGE